MGVSDFILFFSGNSLFTFFIIFISFVFGWVMYSMVILRTIDLKDSLFTKDNPAAWVEFIGAFIAPVLYLAARSVIGAASSNVFLDLVICIGSSALYIFIFTLLRLLSDMIIGALSPKDKDGKIDLNNEIYKQKNVSASLYSMSAAVVFIGLLTFLDLEPGSFTVSLMKMADILVYTVIALTVYMLLLKPYAPILTEIFVRNNAAAGINLLGFTAAVEILLGNAVALQDEFHFTVLLIVSGLGLLILGAFSYLFRRLFSGIIRVNFLEEVYRQNNSGAAFGQAVMYIGIANVIVSFMK